MHTPRRGKTHDVEAQAYVHLPQAIIKALVCCMCSLNPRMLRSTARSELSPMCLLAANAMLIISPLALY
jgi:hypothetical protein